MVLSNHGNVTPLSLSRLPKLTRPLFLSTLNIMAGHCSSSIFSGCVYPLYSKSVYTNLQNFFDWIFNFDLKYSMSKIPFRNIQVTKSTIPIPFLNKLVPLLSPGNIAASQPTKGNLLCSLNIVNMISVPIRRHGLSPSSEIHALLLITLDILHLYVFGFAHHK